MNIDTTKELHGYDGKPIHAIDASGKVTSKVWTLGDILCAALISQNTKLTGEEKLERYLLAQRISLHQCVALTVEEAALVKKLVAEAFPINVVGAVWQMIEKPPEVATPKLAAVEELTELDPRH